MTWKIFLIILFLTSLLLSCTTINSETPPSEIVKIYANSPDARYYYMSSEYRKKTTEEEFRKKVNNCTPSKWAKYKLIDIINEKIEGNRATVTIVYIITTGSLIERINPPKNSTKEIELIKEKDGWKLPALHCELVGN